MKIIVVSDTHMPKKGKILPVRLTEELATADRIIHAGDWQTPEVYNQLKKYGQIDGVCGNTDNEQMRRIVPDKKALTIEGFKIGIVHGHGTGKTTEKRAAESFSEKMDCIIFGHSHIPYLRYVNKTLLFNPGSVMDKRKMPYFSFGILTLSDYIHAEFIFFS
ncbi:metallophosphoesterase family protein [Salipaludibacillus aurantiacus]|uniref:Phosphoesterase n=1 Tax=Salipaludibacillus aurantiacus TaxID=1601833 RepID=A0A1H9TGQ9_9BACI|nr:metallophosphoesterase family protein [Salipaludibacillus aurantiacus]SER96029.1 hypothetical protein SAMN05518684_105314 [Salipaludibacillus aurantiacus]